MCLWEWVIQMAHTCRHLIQTFTQIEEKLLKNGGIGWSMSLSTTLRSYCHFFSSLITLLEVGDSWLIKLKMCDWKVSFWVMFKHFQRSIPARQWSGEHSYGEQMAKDFLECHWSWVTQVEESVPPVVGSTLHYCATIALSQHKVVRDLAASHHNTILNNCSHSMELSLLVTLPKTRAYVQPNPCHPNYAAKGKSNGAQ